MIPRSDDILCRTCAKVNLCTLKEARKRQTNRELEFDEFWDLPKVLNERNCPLCRLLLWCFRGEEGFDFTKVGKWDLICGVYTDYELQLFFVTRSEGTKRSSYSIQLCGTENEQTQEILEKIMPNAFNVEELRSWLNKCSEGHRECKTRDKPSKPLPKDFRLIDVKRGCIVRAESDPTYCALSYVWGSGNQLTLRKGNLTELEKEHALSNNELLPKTITDAIKLCQEISQNFLWVDCLCILQDGEEDKHSQIASMDAVYNLAFLTIVAAAGDDATSGLPPFNAPRLSPNCSLHFETISDNNFVSSLSPKMAAEAIAGLKWATRGWTLQEYVLSKRVVVFTGKYVFFRCEEALWAEDFGLRFQSFCDSGPSWDLPLYGLSTIVSDKYAGNYPQLVAQYIRRTLTREEDMLNAFLGILSRLEDDIGTHFWGLPSKELGRALLWVTDLSFPFNRRPSFPSWSWAGWIHDPTVPDRSVLHDGIYMHHKFDLWANHSSMLTCYKIGDDGKIQCFEKHKIDRIISMHSRVMRELKRPVITPVEEAFDKHFTPPSTNEHILNSYISAKDRSGPPLSHYVFFWTSCGTLHVDRQPKNKEGDPRIWDFAIRLQPDDIQLLGYVRLDIEWRERQPDMLEFAVTTAGYDGLAVKFRVLLITTCDDSTPKVYTRVAAAEGGIEPDDWVKIARPEQRLIALI